ncbi:hypothetical protein KIN20_012374 [Parelaphostrongylus tenuis]|uniref:Uncharacterized protein n=1 Tax=Parelaphostrongylus tenuis TaxID=148309 RepID=A0AAD5MUP1_PARTN|nr:hypothetical protein KIN20_012374 [Parelaphostrongylus tenuis]
MLHAVIHSTQFASIKWLQRSSSYEDQLLASLASSHRVAVTDGWLASGRIATMLEEF